MPKPIVEITQSGRGGSIYYRESVNTVAFDWEFALSPVLAEILGTKSKDWDETHPWAAGRQVEIFDFVAKEVVRQKTDDCAFEIDVDAGSIVVFQLPAKFLDLRNRRLAGPSWKSSKLSRKGVKRSTRGSEKSTRAYKDFMASVPAPGGSWAEGQAYNLVAFKKMSEAEKQMVVALLAGRDVTWREVAVFNADGSPKSVAALQAAVEHHLSIDTRLAAAEALAKRGRMPELERFLSRQIRMLDRPENGLGRALTLAAKYSSEIVRQALLWASYNATDCAPQCARLLLLLTEAAKEPFSSEIEKLLSQLGRHSSYFDRKAAFDQLCGLLKMELQQANCD